MASIFIYILFIDLNVFLAYNILCNYIYCNLICGNGDYYGKNRERI